jgi:hypothetical protein
MTDIFSPPPNPSDGEGYTFGNIVWEYEQDNGVWNIKDASLVGAAGAQGPIGAQGAIGSQGNIGSQGSVGSSGLPGEPGPQGFQGVQGRQGSIGAQGNIGSQGTDGAQGSIGAQGTQGTQGVQGPAGSGLDAGSIHQVLYKNDSNEVAGDAEFLFNGVGATFSGLTFAFGSSTDVMNGIYRLPKEWSVYVGDASGSSITISPANGTIQRYIYTPDASGFTVNFGSGWSETVGSVETIAVLLQMANGFTGGFNTNIHTESGARKPVIGGYTGGIDILTMMRVKTSSGELRLGFQVANGMTGSTDTLN